MFRHISILIIFFLVCPLEASDIDNKLKNIPLKDREKIERLFSCFVSHEGLGFVLFKETKPACMISLPLTHKRYVMPYKVDNPLRFQRDLGLCWQAWTYYRHLFKHPGVIVCEEYESINGGMYLQLFIINKKTVKSLLENHRDDFAEVLGEEFTPQRFINKLEKKKKLRPLIHRDDKLLGLLLGFGRESSTAFRDLARGIDISPPLSRAGRRPIGCCIAPVSFRGNPDSPEVKTLVETYTKEILEIEDIFKGDAFLTDILKKFCSPYTQATIK